MSQSDDIASGSNAHPNIRPYENQPSPRRASGIEYPPPIPVALRHPRIVASVKQYRSEAQQQQLQQHIVSESFIPVAPGAIKPPRRRRRPPFSYSALIAQAILESENERMTLREIYKWIMNKYPALYDASDTGWQNTIRHNLSLNRCFKKEPRVEGRGKGGYWTVDPEYKARFRNGTFINTTPSPAVQHKQPREIRAKEPEKDEEAADTDDHTSSSPETVRCDPRNPHSPLFIASEYQQLQQQRNLHYAFKTTNPPEEHGKPPQQPLSASSIPLFSTSTSCASTPSHTSVAPPSIPSSSSPSQVMQIHNLLN